MITDISNRRDIGASRCLNLQHYRYENLKSRVLKPAGNNLSVQ